MPIFFFTTGRKHFRDVGKHFKGCFFTNLANVAEKGDGQCK